MYYDYFEGFEYYIEKDYDKFYIYIQVDKRYRTIAKNYEWYVKTKDNKLWLCIESKNNALNSVVYEAKDVIYKLRTQWRLDDER